MVFIDDLYFICWKVYSKIKEKYFPFQNIYFVHSLTIVKIVPIYNIKLIETAHIWTLPWASFCMDAPLLLQEVA